MEIRTKVLNLLLCLVETFFVDFMPLELNSIPEELTLLLVGLKTRIL